MKLKKTLSFVLANIIMISGLSLQNFSITASAAEDSTSTDKVKIGVETYNDVDILLTQGQTDLYLADFETDLRKALTDKGLNNDKIHIQASGSDSSESTGSFEWAKYSHIPYVTSDTYSAVSPLTGNKYAPLSHHRSGTIEVNDQGTYSDVCFTGNWVMQGSTIAIAPVPEPDAGYVVNNQVTEFDYTLGFGDSITAAGYIITANRRGDYLDAYVLSINNTATNGVTSGWSSKVLYNGGKNSGTYTPNAGGKTGAIFKVTYNLQYTGISEGHYYKDINSDAHSSGLHGDYKQCLASFNFATTGHLKVVNKDGTISLYYSSKKGEQESLISSISDVESGEYFGFFMENYNHGCSSTGSFLLKNLTTETNARMPYSAVLTSGVGVLQPSHLHFIVNVDDKVDNSLNTSTTAALTDSDNGYDGLHFIGWGNSYNESIMLQFLKEHSAVVDDSSGVKVSDINAVYGPYFYDSNGVLRKFKGTFLNQSMQYTALIKKTADYIYNIAMEYADKSYVVKENPASLIVEPESMRFNSKEGSGQYKYGKWTVKHYSKIYDGDVQFNKNLYAATALIEADIDSSGNIVPHQSKTSKYNTDKFTAKINTVVGTEDKDIQDGTIVTGYTVNKELAGKITDGNIASYEKVETLDGTSYKGSWNTSFEKVGTEKYIVLRNWGLDSYMSPYNSLTFTDGSTVSTKNVRCYKLKNGVEHQENWTTGKYVKWTLGDAEGAIGTTYTTGDLELVTDTFSITPVEGDDTEYGTENVFYVLADDYDDASNPFKLGKFSVSGVSDAAGYDSTDTGYVLYKEVYVYKYKYYTSEPVYLEAINYQYDPIIVHDYPVYGEADAELQYTNNLPLYKFDDEVGLYEIFYEDQLLKTVYEHRKPVANFRLDIGPLQADGTKTLGYINKSYDLDHYYSDGVLDDDQWVPGIKSLTWEYKRSDETQYHVGKIDKINDNYEYVIRLTVKDREGEKTTYSQVIGNGSLPPIAQFTITGDDVYVDAQTNKKTIPIDGKISYDDKSYDPNGLKLSHYYWIMSYKADTDLNSRVIVNKSETYPTKFSEGTGTYIITLQVENSAGVLSNICSDTIYVVPANRYVYYNKNATDARQYGSTKETITRKSETEVIQVDTTINDRYCVRDGYNFLGWNTNPKATWVYDNEYVNNNKKLYLGTEDITLYAIYEKPITLTFDLNGGKYNGSTSDIVLSSVMYNSQTTYTFDINKGKTSAKDGYYKAQTGIIDAYGSYNVGTGVNTKYTKKTADGMTYRFLGWSLNENATEPDSSFIVYSSSHKTKYTINKNTTLYAVWEPELQMYVKLNNSDGNRNFTDGSSPVLSASASASDPIQYLSIIARPGDMLDYSIILSGNSDRTLHILFDSKITDIYDDYGSWTDGYNASTSEDLVSGQKHGLNRNIYPVSKYIKREFTIPMYLGTKFSHPSSIGVGKYYVVFEMEQNSYYSKHYSSNSKEKVRMVAVIYISPNKNYNGQSDPGPDSPVIPANPDYPIHSPAELRTTVEEVD